MPNNQIDPSIHDSLTGAFGGSNTPAARQPSAPVAPPPGGSATGPSLWDALINYLKPNQTFGQNAGEALTKDKYVR